MEIVRVIRILLPAVKLLVARTPSKLDDAVVEAIELFLGLIDNAASRADIAVALRQAANEVEKS